MSQIETYAWSGQPISEWPRWLLARNYARCSKTDRLVIHGFLEVLEFMPGDEIGLLSDRTIVKNGKS